MKTRGLAQENPVSTLFQILTYSFSHIEMQDLFSLQGGIFLKQVRGQFGKKVEEKKIKIKKTLLDEVPDMVLCLCRS